MICEFDLDNSTSKQQKLTSIDLLIYERALSNVVLSAIALAGERCVIEPDHLPQDFIAQETGFDSYAPKSSGGAAQLLTLDEAQNELIQRTIRACDGNRSAAARALRISRGTLYNRLKRG